MKKLLFILPFLLLLSCSVQKRKYQKGFYVSTHKTKNQSKKENHVSAAKNVKPETLIQKTTEVVEPIYVEASAENKLIPIRISKYRYLVAPPDSCDLITLKNGSEVQVKVLEITPIQIKYKKCNLVDGPLYIAEKSDVFMIKYSNGTKEIIKAVEPTNSEFNGYNSNPNSRPQTNRNTENSTPKKVHPLAIAALVFAILGFITYGILSIVGALMANAALRKIKENPNVFKGKGLATTAKIMSLVTIGVVAFVVLLVLLAVMLGA